MGIRDAMIMSILIYVILASCTIVVRSSDTGNLVPDEAERNNRNDQHRPAKHSRSRKKNLRWNFTLKHDLRMIWYETQPDRIGHTGRLKSRWDEVHPEKAHLNAKHLRDYAKHLFRDFDNDPRRGGKKLNWTEELDDELLSVWYQTLPVGRNHDERIYEEWIQRHPEHNQSTIHNLHQRASRLYKMMQDGPHVGYDLSRKYFKWTTKMKEDLIEIWRTTPHEKGRKTAIHKEWIKRNPKYAYLTENCIYQQAYKLTKKIHEGARQQREITDKNITNPVTDDSQSVIKSN